MISSSTETSSMPMLMPACSGMSIAREGLAVSAAKAVRELAKVLTRMPNAATEKLPEMPITLNSRMMPTL